MGNYLAVALGAVFGATARYALSGWVAQRLGASYPLGTLAVNVSGSFLLGLFLPLSTQRLLLDPRLRLSVAVGFLGSYTTFSSLAVESLHLLLSGQWALGLANLMGSTLLGGLAAALGIFAGRAL